MTLNSPWRRVAVAGLLAAAIAWGAVPSAPEPVHVHAVAQADLPAGVAASGQFVGAMRWDDRSGPNLAVWTRTLEDGNEGRSATLLAVGYRLTPGGAAPVWRVEDGTYACQLDMPTFFEPSSFQVTDLDGNGIAEVSFVYRKACNGGMDLIDEKLFLVEGGKKYAVRGATELVGPDDPQGPGHYDGPMWVDKAFNDAPLVFKTFAVSKWRKFRRPTGW